ncbi:HIT family protein [Neolewinella agarilytica]|uniref:Histidine triad (HIT) family protein n=1 Tax=Neolewinella agarilytica TaxID=478744 RepID=A0A1H9KH11_9BACT|nr:HIT family protein [Neolewinella agarilytica]SEQ98123.1 histidine triad (HIT) family protein [Neolewinella agarilytica]
MATIFTRIVQGEIPCYRIAETEEFLAFLDVRPMTEGHTLCIIKREEDYYFDLSDEELTGLTLFSKRVAKALQAVVPCKRIAVGVLGLEVPHTHVHLVPVTSEGDFRFGKSIAVSEDRMKEIAAAVAAEMEA